MHNSDQPISFTPAAVAHIESQLANRADPWGIKLGIKTTGCSGFAYVVEFFDGTSCQEYTNEKPYVINGINVAMSDATVVIVQGTVIDYVTEGLKSGLVFNNPQVESMCGCGESFTV